MHPHGLRPPLLAASVTLLLTLCPAAPAVAQWLPLPRLEVGADAGAATTSSWFRARDVERAPGTGIAAGAHATYWLTPVFGVRANARYFDGSLASSPITLPPSSGSATIPGVAVPVHGWSFGSEVVTRPFAFSGAAPVVSRLYGYAGVSRLATGFTGATTPRPDSLVFTSPTADSTVGLAGGSPCATVYVREGICLLEHAARVQLSAGAGTEIPLPVRGLALYAEVGVQLYRAPAELIPLETRGFAFRPSRSPGGPAAVALASLPGAAVHDAVTGRLTLGAKYTTGSIVPPPPPPPPPPLPPAPPPGPVAPPAAGATVSVRVPAGMAEVYLVPVVSAAAQPRIFCRLRPDPMSPYFKGRAMPEAELQVNGTAQPYILVVRSEGREQRIRVSLADGTSMVRIVDLRQASTPVCTR